MKSEILAYCGLVCESCPIHLATIAKDRNHQRAIRESVAQLCKRKYGMELAPEEITDCYGCLSDTGILFSGCQDCEIRTCAMGKHLTNCACCDVFPCYLLQEHFMRDPKAGIRLERIRKSLTQRPGKS